MRVCLYTKPRKENIMANNSISPKSSKGVQLGRVITVQPKVDNVKGVGEPRDPACGLKVNSVSPTTALTHERIAERARVIWQNRGCRIGEDKQNWQQAETQLKAELGID
jgi:hypothetical protein